MATRFSPQPRGSLSSGYDHQNISDVQIPPCGLEDVDVALFSIFDKELRFYVTNNEAIKESNLKKVPVIFAAGEKWAMLKKGQPLRDKSGTLILPLITVMRTGVEQSVATDIVGRGINQQTGVLKVRRKLDSSDRVYQNLINKIYLINQQNVAVNPADPHVMNQLLTTREVGSQRNDLNIKNGAVMAPNISDNVYETLTIPAPQFFSAKYEITFWTQYTQQMNQLMEVFMSSFLPQGQCFKLSTNKGYWFVAYVEESYTQENNFEDMSQQERLIKQKFTINVPAYLLASSAPGVPIAVRRFVSSPIIKFESPTTLDAQELVDNPSPTFDYPFLGADDPTLPLQDGGHPQRSDYRKDGKGPLGPQTGAAIDPALSTYRRGESPGVYAKNGNTIIKVTTSSATTGEKSYQGMTFDQLNDIIND